MLMSVKQVTAGVLWEGIIGEFGLITGRGQGGGGRERGVGKKWLLLLVVVGQVTEQLSVPSANRRQLVR